MIAVVLAFPALIVRAEEVPVETTRALRETRHLRLRQVLGDFAWRQADGIGGLAFDDRRVFTTAIGHADVSVWDRTTGAVTRRLTTAGRFRPELSLSNGRLATASDAVQLWDAESGQELARLDLRAAIDDVPRSAVFLDDGTLALGTARGVVLRFEMR